MLLHIELPVHHYSRFGHKQEVLNEGPSFIREEKRGKNNKNKWLTDSNNDSLTTQRGLDYFRCTHNCKYNSHGSRMFDKHQQISFPDKRKRLHVALILIGSFASATRSRLNRLWINLHVPQVSRATDSPLCWCKGCLVLGYRILSRWNRL